MGQGVQVVFTREVNNLKEAVGRFTLIRPPAAYTCTSLLALLGPGMGRVHCDQLQEKARGGTIFS